MAVAGSFGHGSQLTGSASNERRADTVSEQWRLRLWSRSSDCQHLVYLLLSRSRKPRIAHVLATVVPSFLKLSRKDAFLEAVASQHLSDQILQTAVIEFLARWRPQTTRARVSDLEADSQVAAVMDQLLPETLTLVEWLVRRMHQDIELEGNGNTTTMYITVHARPLVLHAYECWVRRQSHA